VERTRVLTRLRQTLAAVARQRRSEEAAREGWPLPASLRLHLWLYGQGLVPPTIPKPNEP
jgi:hypothetical protein